MATYDGNTVIAVGLNNVVQVSTDGGESHIFEMTDTVACRFHVVFLNAYQRCWRSWTLPLCTFTLTGASWNFKTLGPVNKSPGRHGFFCISSFHKTNFGISAYSDQQTMIAGKTPYSLFSLFSTKPRNALFWLYVLCLCKITSPSDREFHCYRYVTRYALYSLLFYVILLLN